MSKWEMVKLGDICFDKIPTLSSKDNILIDYVDISSVDNQIKKVVSFQTIESKGAPSRAKQILNRNDIIVSTVRPNLNAVAVNNIESENMIVASTGYCVLRCKEMADISYVFNYCKSKSFVDGLIKKAKGASYPAVSNSDVKDSMIPLPPIGIQKQIADTLDKTQGIIDCHKKQLEELDNLIKATFFDMFGDPIENKYNWKCALFNEVFDIIDGDRGVNYPKQEDFSNSGYCVFLNTGNVTIDGFNFEKVQYISKDKDSQLRKGKLVRGDIVFTTRGTIGNLAYYENDVPYDTMRINSGMVLLRSKINIINPIFFCALFRNPDMISYYKTFLSGTAQPQLPITNMKKIGIILPPLDLQTKFAEIVTNIEQQKTIVKQSITESQNLFNSLMSKYFD